MSVTILMIDADASAAAALQQQLSGYDALFVHVANGKEGLAKVGTIMPDLVMIDVVTGDGSGFLTYSRLKKSGMPAGTAVFITGSREHKADMKKHAGLKSRAHAYLFKPYDLEGVTSAYQKAMGRSLDLESMEIQELDEADIILEEEDNGIDIEEFGEIDDTVIAQDVAAVDIEELDDVEILDDDDDMDILVEDIEQVEETGAKPDPALERRAAEAAEEVERLNKKVQDMEAELTKERQSRVRLEGERQVIQNELDDRRTQLERLQTEHASGEEQKELFKDTLQKKDDEIRSLSLSVADKDHAIRELEDETKKLRTASEKSGTPGQLADMEAELSRSQHELNTAQMAVQELKKQLKSVKAGSRSIEEYRELEARMNATEEDMIDLQTAKAEGDEKLKLAQSELQKIKSDNERLTSEFEAFKDSASNNNTELEDVVNRLRDEHEKSIQQRDDKIAELDDDLNTTRKALVEAEKRSIRSAEEMSKQQIIATESSKKLKEIELEHMDSANTIDDLREQVNMLEQEKAKVERELFDMEQEKESAEQEVQELKALRDEAEKIKVELGTQANKIEALELENRVLAQEKEKANNRLKQAESDLESVKEELKQKQEEAISLSEQCSSHTDTIASRDTALKESGEKIEDLQTKLEAANTELDETKETLQTVSEDYEKQIAAASEEHDALIDTLEADNEKKLQKAVAEKEMELNGQIETLTADVASRDETIVILKDENSRNEERVITAYQRIKEFETFRQRIEKAVELTSNIIRQSREEEQGDMTPPSEE